MQLSESDRLVHRNDFATRCFREVADKDYIAARTSYRFGLVEPFLWSALQAVEKYLKAILLYNEHTTKSLGHDVEKAYRRVVNISDLRCEFPQTVAQFIRYLGRHASSRYLERPYYTMGCELLKLDLSVWHLRRYCQDLRHEPNKVDKREWLAIMLKSIAVERWEDEPQRFQVPGGFLEKVLKGRRDSELREALLWKNPCYGARFRRRLRNYKHRSHSANPPHYLHPEPYDAVKDLVYFSRDVIEDMTSRYTCAPQDAPTDTAKRRG